MHRLIEDRLRSRSEHRRRLLCNERGWLPRSKAANYDSTANVRGDCTYKVFGCTDSNALNYAGSYAYSYEEAGTYSYSDGADSVDEEKGCVFPRRGCMEPSARNFDSTANIKTKAASMMCLVVQTLLPLTSTSLLHWTTACASQVFGLHVSDSVQLRSFCKRERRQLHLCGARMHGFACYQL